MKNTDEKTSLRIHIATAEAIRKKANNKLEKEMARYLVKRLKNSLLQLCYPKPKEL